MERTKIPQHRQHFNLSNISKQMLDTLTAKHYPGRQRRQSQFVEDLITEAYKREYGTQAPPDTDSPEDSTLSSSAPTLRKIAEPGVSYMVADASPERGQCVSCQRAVQADWKYCVYCGVAQAQLCPRCGTRRADVEGAHFCFDCGSALE